MLCRAVFDKTNLRRYFILTQMCNCNCNNRPIDHNGKYGGFF